MGPRPETAERLLERELLDVIDDFENEGTWEDDDVRIGAGLREMLVLEDDDWRERADDELPGVVARPDGWIENFVPPIVIQ